MAADVALLVARVVTGAFIVWGVWDNVTSAARMAEFARFLASEGFPLPRIAAPFSVYTQLVAGVGLAAGLLTRWAGWLLVANMAVALVMVDAENGIRAAWPATGLILLGLLFVGLGPGRYAVDRR